MKEILRQMPAEMRPVSLHFITKVVLVSECLNICPMLYYLSGNIFYHLMVYSQS